MAAKSMLICPKNIVTYFHDEFKNEENARKVVHAVRSRKSRMMTLVVEEVSKGKYVLIENFTYYSALMKVQPDVRVPCHVYPCTSDVERLIHILSIVIPLEKRTTTWLFKNKHIMKLKHDYGFSEREIARRTKLDIDTITNYVLDVRIPPPIREKAIKMQAKTVLEKIASSTVIPEEMKLILYEKAVIEEGNIYRLNTKKFEYMKEFCSSNQIPLFILRNQTALEKLIHYLISGNFDLSRHMQSLLVKFLNLYGGNTYQESIEKEKEVSIH